ncbi:MAG: class I SAM-dependent methyltransferase [Microthrixaceae bacterium]
MAAESADRNGTEGSGHYFDSAPRSASRPSEVRLRLPEGTFTLVTDRGVFSSERIDPGTRALLDKTSPLTGGTGDLPAGDLVDVGAGYGPIAVALAARFPDRHIWAVEPNERARELARMNLRNNCPGAAFDVVAPGEVPDDLRVAALYSNPPIRIGKLALQALLSEWLDRLVPDGHAMLVVQRHLGADSLARWLGSRGRSVKRVASRKGYRILEVRNGP